MRKRHKIQRSTPTFIDYMAWGIRPKEYTIGLGFGRQKKQKNLGLVNVCQFCDSPWVTGRGTNLIKIAKDYYVHERCIYTDSPRSYPGKGW